LIKFRVSARACRVMSKILEFGPKAQPARARVLFSKITSNFKRDFMLQTVGIKVVERIQNFEFIFNSLNQTIE
jgi:hypothetical protein